MVRSVVLLKRLKKLDEYLEILESFQKFPKEDFLKKPEYYGSTERFLHLSIEALLDIGNHIIADQNLGEVNWYRDIPEILAKQSIISDKLKNIWIDMIGFRNMLVHEYLDIDRNIVYDILHSHLNDIKDIKNCFLPFLENPG